MPPSRLRLKIIKDASIDATGAAPRLEEARLRVLDLSMLPFILYVRIDLPAAEPAEPQPLFLHLLGRPGPQEHPNTLFLTTRIPEEASPETPSAGRRLLLLLTGDDIPDGRYRLALVRARQHIAFADIAKRSDQIRVLTRSAGRPAPDPLPLLISGTHKSGTTWLETVLDAHPDIMVLHEANTFNVLDQNALRAMVAARQLHFRDRQYIRWLEPGFDVNDFTRLVQIGLARELTLRLGRAWGSRYVADRTPGYSGLYIHLPRFWDGLRILHIVRHPLDVLASRLFHEANLARNAGKPAAAGVSQFGSLNARLDTGAALAPGEYVTEADVAGETLRNLMQDWRRDQEDFLSAQRVWPECLHRVRYEDLLGNFAGEARQVFAFIGTEAARTDLGVIARRTSFAALSGGRQPGEADPHSFFRKGIAGDWRNVFSPQQAAALWSPVAGTATQFGYSLIASGTGDQARLA